eukprot:5449129-Heterocapsa_arctica.AAC.1
MRMGASIRCLVDGAVRNHGNCMGHRHRVPCSKSMRRMSMSSTSCRHSACAAACRNRGGCGAAL